MNPSFYCTLEDKVFSPGFFLLLLVSLENEISSWLHFSSWPCHFHSFSLIKNHPLFPFFKNRSLMKLSEALIHFFKFLLFLEKGERKRVAVAHHVYRGKLCFLMARVDKQRGHMKFTEKAHIYIIGAAVQIFLYRRVIFQNGHKGRRWWKKEIWGRMKQHILCRVVNLIFNIPLSAILFFSFFESR